MTREAAAFVVGMFFGSAISISVALLWRELREGPASEGRNRED